MSGSERLANATCAGAAARLARARGVVVYSGAGVSKESGISTFRDPSEGPLGEVRSHGARHREAYARDPAFVWAWYMDRFGLIEQAQPNPANAALAELAELVPLTIVTQNIDGLHQRAGSRDVIELHGSALRFKCLEGRHTGLSLADLAGSDELRLAARTAARSCAPTSSGSARRCRARARAGVRPGGGLRVLLAVGTSGVVYPLPWCRCWPSRRAPP